MTTSVWECKQQQPLQQTLLNVKGLLSKGSNFNRFFWKSKWHTCFLPFQDALDDNNNGCLRRQTMATTAATFSQPFHCVNGILIKDSNLTLLDLSDLGGVFWEKWSLSYQLLTPWFILFCTIHVVTFSLISNLATDYIQKRRGQPGLFSFEYNLSPKLISK